MASVGHGFAPLSVGTATYGEPDTMCVLAKPEGTKKKTGLYVGDFVIMKEKTGATGEGLVEKVTTTNKGTQGIFGVVVCIPITGFKVTVAIRGHIAVVLDNSIFANAKNGTCFKTGTAGGCCGRNILVEEKQKLKKPNGSIADGWSVLIK